MIGKIPVCLAAVDKVEIFPVNGGSRVLIS
jgi:hypothetical protein